MKVVNFTCPGCGAQMVVKPGGREAVSALITNEVVSAEPVKMFLLTDGKNFLYDVYEVGYKMRDDSVKTVYIRTVCLPDIFT